MNTLRVTLRGLQELRLGAPEFNSQLAVIAALLFETARDLDPGADPAIIQQVARALVVLAGYSTDEAQVRSLIWVAGEIANGRGGLFDVDDPFAVSPN